MVQRARYRRGMSQRTVSDLAGCSNAVVFRLEGRKHSITLRSAVKLAKTLNLDLNTLKDL